jgi:hypothetical protein
MTYFSPPFAQLDQELFSPRARYLSNRIHNGVYQECICSIDALNNVITASFSEASASLQVGNIGSLSASKALDSDLSGQQRHKESWTHLKRVAQEVMDTFVAYGPRCAIAALQNKLPAGCRVPDERVPRDLDDRLSLGIVRDLSAAKVVQLPSGGRATLEVGDDVAALSISTSKTEGGSTFALVFDSRKHKEPAALIDEKLTKIRALMDDLATGSFNSQVLALDHLQQLATDQFDRRCTLAHVCGSNTAQVLSTLHELGSLRVWLPNTASQRGRLELLQGYERVHITLAQPSGSELPLVAFSSIELLISPHGAIDIFAWNNLRNCLSAQLSAESVEHLGGTGNVALRLALAISTHDRSQAHTRLYRLLAQMVATAPSESQLMSAPFASRHTFPPDNEWERRSFNLATNIVETAHGFSKSYGNHAASWLSLSRSTAIIDFLGGAHILRFYTNDTSITGVHIENRPVSFTKYELTIHRFHIEGPASELLQQRLPELLQDYAEFATQHDGPTPDSAILARTRLFAFLVEHGKPMTTQSASDISTP